MAGNEEDIGVDVEVHGSEKANAELRSVGAAAGNVGTRASAMGASVKAAGIVAAAAVAGMAVEVAIDLGKTGLELQLMGQRVEQIFGESAEDVNEWAGSVNREFGTSQQRVAGLAAEVGDLLIPLGATREEAAALSADAVQLGSSLDLWSTRTNTTAEATRILVSGILGETEGLKSLGIQIDQATIDAHLYEQGLGDLEGQERKLAEATAVLEIATSQSSDAIAFAGSESAETQLKMREMQARFTEVKDELAEQLLPAFIWMAEEMIKFIDWLEADGIPGGRRFIDEWIVPVINFMADMVAAVDWVIDKLMSLIEIIDRIPDIPHIPISIGDGGIERVKDAARAAAEQEQAILDAIEGNEVLEPQRMMVDKALMPVAAAQPLGRFSQPVAPVEINVTAGLGDPSEVGKAVVAAIEQYERRNGTTWRAA